MVAVNSIKTIKRIKCSFNDPSELAKLAEAISPYVPFTHVFILQQCLNKKAKTMLDVGSGKGKHMKYINKKGEYIATGVDIYPPCIEHCKLQGIYYSLYCCDMRALPFKEKSFDIILCLNVLEHLDKQDGNLFLQQIGTFASSQIVLDIPVGQWEQGAYDGNPFQVHRSTWYPGDLRKLGFKVRGYAPPRLLVKILWNLPNGLRLIYYSVYVLLSPFVYYFPRLAGSMICVKNLSSEGEK